MRINISGFIVGIVIMFICLGLAMLLRNSDIFGTDVMARNIFTMVLFLIALVSPLIGVLDRD